MVFIYRYEKLDIATRRAPGFIHTQKACSNSHKVVLRFSAFQNIQNFQDRSSAARDIFILVRRLRDFRSDPVLRSTFAKSKIVHSKPKKEPNFGSKKTQN